MYIHITASGCKIQILNGICWLFKGINRYTANMFHLVTAQHTTFYMQQIFRLAWIDEQILLMHSLYTLHAYLHKSSTDNISTLYYHHQIHDTTYGTITKYYIQTYAFQDLVWEVPVSHYRGSYVQTRLSSSRITS